METQVWRFGGGGKERSFVCCICTLTLLYLTARRWKPRPGIHSNETPPPLPSSLGNSSLGANHHGGGRDIQLNQPIRSDLGRVFSIEHRISYISLSLRRSLTSPFFLMPTPESWLMSQLGDRQKWSSLDSGG